MLGRCRREVLLCDSGHYRNVRAQAMHGYLTRDGLAPPELLRLGREELRRYPSVHWRPVAVAHIERLEPGFRVTLSDGASFDTRAVLLATGVADRLPAVAGLEERYGTSVFHCPYCDGWEVRDRRLVAYGRGEKGSGLALLLRRWSSDVTLLTDGPAGIRPERRRQLAEHGIALRHDRVARLHGAGRSLESVVFANGQVLPADALFFAGDQAQASSLPAQLGCAFNRKGTVRCGKGATTGIKHLFVAGDASEDTQLVVVAASEGAQAAVAINTALLKEDLARDASLAGREGR